MRIDGKRFLLAIGMGEESLTPIAIAEALKRLTQTEWMSMVEQGIIEVPDQPELSYAEQLNNESYMYVGYPTEYDIPDSELRKRIKHEKNYMCSMNLKRALGSAPGHGKHAHGRKHVKH